MLLYSNDSSYNNIQNDLLFISHPPDATPGEILKSFLWNGAVERNDIHVVYSLTPSQKVIGLNHQPNTGVHL